MEILPVTILQGNPFWNRAQIWTERCINEEKPASQLRQTTRVPLCSGSADVSDEPTYCQLWLGGPFKLSAPHSSPRFLPATFLTAAPAPPPPAPLHVCFLINQYSCSGTFLYVHLLHYACYISQWYVSPGSQFCISLGRLDWPPAEYLACSLDS